MKHGIYLFECDYWDSILSDVQNRFDTVFFGHYGCQEAAHYSLRQALKLRSEYGMDIHYISPKTSISTIKLEEEHVVKLLESGIDVSINDWGLFYRLKSRRVPFHSVYLGRLLSKSIADWVWSDIFFKKEQIKSINYLSQINFNDSIKIEWLKSHNIGGIEVTIHRDGEKSYEEIQKQGLRIIGYVDNEIAAISRACLFKKTSEQSNMLCNHQCRNVLKAEKTEGQKLLLYVSGNMLTRYHSKMPQWDGYDKLVLDFQNPNMQEIVSLLYENIKTE